MSAAGVAERQPAAAALAMEDELVQQRVLRSLSFPQARELDQRWDLWAHDGQRAPEGEWRVWLMMAGRGFGKTRAGAEWISELARRDGSLRIALVGATRDEVAKVMIEGVSGLKAVCHAEDRIEWVPSNGILRFGSGALAFVYSGEAPEKLRGPEHHFAWCDEIAKWAYPQASWDNLMLGLRLGEAPRTIVTTTPRPIGLLKTLMNGSGIRLTRGASADNPNLPAAFLEAVRDAYAGTRLERQELAGELIEDVEGTLWPRDLIERCRARPFDPGRARSDSCFSRVVVAVDPPAGAGASADACGIVAAALGADGVAYVLADASVQGTGPEGWAGAVSRAASLWGADRVVAEANNGGAMVESVLRACDAGLPVRLVHASHGKIARAEPVAALFEKGRARFAGAFPELEDELAGLTRGGGYEGPGRSPDRADAMVWALTELMLGKAQRVPRVRAL